MKKIDQLKRTQFDISMKILNLETKRDKKGLSKNELTELEILQKKKDKLAEQIATLK
jgi:hypothetical protein